MFSDVKDNILREYITNEVNKGSIELKWNLGGQFHKKYTLKLPQL